MRLLVNSIRQGRTRTLQLFALSHKQLQPCLCPSTLHAIRRARAEWSADIVFELTPAG